MRIAILVSICLAFALDAHAQSTLFHPIYPGENSRDTKPAKKAEVCDIFQPQPGTVYPGQRKSGAAEDGNVVYPTYPLTDLRDFSKPGGIIEGNAIYPTYPGTTIRDFSKPGVRIEGNTVYQTMPGTDIRDFSKPGGVIQGNIIYPTYPGTIIRDFSQPAYRIEKP